MKVVIDTNDFISALIGKKHREKLTTILSTSSIELFADQNLLTEIAEVARREKFRKYVSLAEVDFFLDVLNNRLIVINPSTVVTDSPDPDDNFLLSLAVDANADYLVTGDKGHLLALNPYRGVQIIRLQTLLDILARG